MNRLCAAGLALLAMGALAIRVPDLSLRPFHTDESVHAFKFGQLLEQGVYRYDPNEFHGPTLYFATLPVAWLGSARTYAATSEAVCRLVPVLFGTGLILLLLLIADGLGWRATLVAGLLTALSPAMIFYSRYYIHEMLLLFFTALLIGAGWRYVSSPSLGWACLGGAALGLMHATKETFVFPLAAMGTALAATHAWEHWLVGGQPRFGERIRGRHVGIGLGVALLVSVLFFSSFFTHAPGPLDSIRTYLPWLKRAEGQSPHIHPWYYYLSLLSWTHRGRGPVWTEGLILLLAMAGLVAALSRKSEGPGRPPFLRFVAFYTLLLTLIYSVVPYKTPWCLLGFLQGMIWLAGVGAVALLRWVRWRAAQAALGLLLAAGTVHLGVEAWRASFVYADSQRNPYVYAHTLSDILDLVEKVEKLAEVSPRGHEMVIKVIAPGGDYWPLPWYLRKFENVGWFAQVPDQPGAEVVIASAVFSADLAESLRDSHVTVGFFGLRPGRPGVFLQLYVRAELWREFLARAGGGVAGDQ